LILDEIGLLAVDSYRTKSYIHQMIVRQVLPAYVIYMDDEMHVNSESRSVNNHSEQTTNDVNVFDSDMCITQVLSDNDIPYQIVSTTDPNSEEVLELVQDASQSIFVYSGPGGVILSDRILSTGKKFVHVHPGIVPYYRGSTTLYYSLLNDGNCGATVFYMDTQIDTGPVIMKRSYPAPDDRTTIDTQYDPLIRAKLLVDVLQEYARMGTLPSEPQNTHMGETYFIIHPVLKHLAILSKYEAN
jgi:methionyl-tRNA formyltransferase